MNDRRLWQAAALSGVLLVGADVEGERDDRARADGGEDLRGDRR